MKTVPLLKFFEDLKDPRSHINKRHELNNVIVIGVLAVICGAETWKQMEEFAESKEDFLKKFLSLPNGVPSDDTFNRVFSAIDAKHFERCFIAWATSLSESFNTQVISLDGKTVCGAKSGGEKSPIHIVSAYASAVNLVIGQVKVDEKSNEIKAIPELLDMLFIEGDIVTIDAMGTQTDIAEKIVEKGADYILAVKENQKELYANIMDEFRFAKDISTHEDICGGHGRIETRKISLISDFQFIDKKNTKWKKLNQVIKIESLREFKNSNKPIEKSIRYYISSCNSNAETMLINIRSHWGIENKVHWILDVQFGEDDSRKRAGNAAQNYSIVLKIALNLLKNEKSVKQGVKGKRLKAAWNNVYLMKLLNIKV